MKRLLPILFALLALAGRAQELATGMEISGFRVPDYDDKGQLRAQLYGEHAKVLEGGKVEITNIKIDLFKDGTVAMTLFAPQCLFDTNTREASSDGRVLIESGPMTIAGRGFVWSSAAGRFNILHEAKVLVKPEARKLKKDLSL